MTTFDGKALRLWRVRRGYTQAQLARAAGVSASKLSRLERGEQAPSWRNACKLSEALLVPLDTFRVAMEEVPHEPVC